MSYQRHPLSAAFPSMDEDDFRALVEDIRSHGQRDLATLYDGMVIDGWHRYQACEELGIPCRFEEFQGLDAVAFVRSKNQHRRHYQKSQRAAIEVSLSSWAVAHRPNKGEAASSLSTNKQMADRAGTTERTIRQAKRAHEAGLGEAVRDGDISAERAAEIAKADPELAKQVGRGEISLPKAVEQIKPKQDRREAGPTEKPAPAPKLVEPAAPAIPEGYTLIETEQLETLRQMLAETVADNESMARVWESDDKVKAALAEAARFREQARIAVSRVEGLMNANNEHIRSIKHWKRIAEKLEGGKRAA